VLAPTRATDLASDVAASAVWPVCSSMLALTRATALASALAAYRGWFLLICCAGRGRLRLLPVSELADRVGGGHLAARRAAPAAVPAVRRATAGGQAIRRRRPECARSVAGGMSPTLIAT
jgi:hypothetical protein